ncbi:beta-ketoacyl-ACP synthase II [Paenarthrobacter sp. PH39-S1]|uniref:beta-ketoacyl-[acyl-carrier-protein] synthase family protein n=1 Tax=Paenarthrobacter sp. PH39-S1 TaxID=3046204 RepID=UPI0024B8DEFC|nr:beta-ketoacyl-ACP synthase II [Paenarthrobacter sp. PH39-S1]MDJ0355107.1 beta-ketoacyl-ACP synthase II [Paenarthrobacter sp. PH39-S1]
MSLITSGGTAGSRVVITGIGALTPVGNTAAQTWTALTGGVSGVGPITLFDASEFPTRIAAEVKNFEPPDRMSFKARKRSSRTSQLAVTAAHEAVADAGLPADLSELEAAVFINSAVSGFAEIEDAVRTKADEGLRRISPNFVAASLTNMAACEVAISLGVHGPVNASALACASGAYALLEARCALLAGDADYVIAGGVDASITPVMFGGLSAMRALSTHNEAPTEASRPFDADRDGFVFGEGAVVFVLERLETARARGVRAYAEVKGGALTSDAFHTVAPEPGGKYAAEAIRRGLRNARLEPADIAYICAHGTSTKANDRTETFAIRQALGAAADTVAVSAPKSMTGHLIGAAGALAGLVCARAISEGVIPPTINYNTPDPECDLDYVPNEARSVRVGNALTNAFGFGGQNCVVVFGRAD